VHATLSSLLIPSAQQAAAIAPGPRSIQREGLESRDQGGLRQEVKPEGLSHYQNYQIKEILSEVDAE
jgi:hypothetical protein